tara:strand:+ start:637 stop:819 length:183 start_codon:yes stop_codon:yes gene_type:complete
MKIGDLVRVIEECQWQVGDEAKLNDLLTIVDINESSTLCTAFNARTGRQNHFLTRFLEAV